MSSTIFHRFERWPCNTEAAMLTYNLQRRALSLKLPGFTGLPVELCSKHLPLAKREVIYKDTFVVNCRLNRYALSMLFLHVSASWETIRPYNTVGTI